GELGESLVQRSGVFDEVDVREPSHQIGLAHVTKLHHRQAAVGQRGDEGAERALSRGIADRVCHDLLHRWIIEARTIGMSAPSDAPPADWNSDFYRPIESVMADLFDLETRQALREGAVLLRGRALPVDTKLLVAIEEIAAQAPFRRMVTPGGFE